MCPQHEPAFLLTETEVTGMNMVSRFSSHYQIKTLCHGWTQPCPMIGDHPKHITQLNIFSLETSLTYCKLFIVALHMNDCPNQIHKAKNKCLLHYTYIESQVLASENPDARDAAVIVGAEQDDAGKGVLSEFVQTLEHTCWKRHLAYGHLDRNQKWLLARCSVTPYLSPILF